MKFDEYFTNNSKQFTFPLLYVINASDALAVFLSHTPIGNLPVVIDYNGKFNQIFSIQTKPETLKRFIRLFDSVLFKSATEYVRIKTLYEIVESQIIVMENWSWTR